jgi:hypothetical protein
MNHSTLRILNISHNCIRYRGACALGDTKVLRLSRNLLEPKEGDSPRVTSSGTIIEITVPDRPLLTRKRNLLMIPFKVISSVETKSTSVRSAL